MKLHSAPTEQGTPQQYPPSQETSVRIELVIRPADLRAGSLSDNSSEKEHLKQAVMCGIRRIVRPIPGLSVQAESDSLRILTDEREIDLGPEIVYWFVNSIRSGEKEAATFEVILPQEWLRPGAAESAILLEPVA